MNFHNKFKIRDLRNNDGAQYHRLIGENLSRFQPVMPALPEDAWSDEFWDQKVNDWVEDVRTGAAIRYVVTTSDDHIIGDISYTNIARGPFLACNLSYRIDSAYEGQGVMRRALEHCNHLIFSETGLHRIMANYKPDNVKSGALLRRLGFCVEGYARDYLHLNGAWEDHILTSKLSDLPTPPRP